MKIILMELEEKSCGPGGEVIKSAGEEYQVVYWRRISSCQEGKGISWPWSVGKNIKLSIGE